MRAFLKTKFTGESQLSRLGEKDNFFKSVSLCDSLNLTFKRIIRQKNQCLRTYKLIIHFIANAQKIVNTNVLTLY